MENNIEFRVGSDGQIWLQQQDGQQRPLTQHDTEIINLINAHIQALYPDTAQALDVIYQSSAPNKPYHRYLTAARFIRCNMASDDLQRYDINGSVINLERVQCPIRGLCPHDGIICNPTPSALNPAEQQVAVLYAQGYTARQIAASLKKNMSTVNNQLWHLAKKINARTRHELIRIIRSLNLI